MTDMMPLNHGATVGVNAGVIEDPSASNEVRCLAASRSWIWSVRAYGLIPPARSSGDVLGTVVGRPSASFSPDFVPAPL